ncbi:cold-shock protein [Aureispira anguillae]|uniref:Cold shock domain-containing protein n=1 Tax=Aureispira anguillae TaxID=2864201 RepID=A0A916DTL3_9BACT|nr:cold shock domain-containing protein [Aureispira anguillae]BDS11576.1 cold shock domain-containing protein [Aureispira anguillae]
MADSFNKKEREKKKEKRRKEKAERKLKQKLEGNKTEEFMYLDENGNLTPIKPDPSKKTEINLEDIEIGVPKKTDLEEELVQTGVVKFFNTEKGYGFITKKDSNESIFVHVNNLIDEIKDKDKVAFEVEMGAKGPIAVNVKLLP